MFKKSQVTLYIVIVAAILLAMVIFLFYNNTYAPDTDIKQNINLNQEAVAMQNFISRCIDLTAKKSFLMFGKQGGEINITSPMLELNVDNITSYLPFLYDEGNVTLVFLKEWESRLSENIESSLSDCLGDEVLQKYKIEPSQPTVNVTAEGYITNVEVTWPIDLYTGEIKSKLQEVYPFRYDINLIHIFDDVFAVLAHTYIIPDRIDILYLNRLNTSLHYSIYEDVIIYTIFDPTSSLDGKPYQFSFAVRLNESWTPTNETS